jgi:O-antigen ligase
MKELLKYSIWGGIFLTLVIPFFVANTMFFPYISGKAFAFRIITEIIFGLWLILIIKNKEFCLKYSGVLGSVIFLVLVLLIADINAVAPFKAFWSNYERMEGFVTFVHLLAYFLVLGSMLNKEKMWLWFFRLNIFAGLTMAITSITQGAKENIVRIAGPLGNPIYISVYFLFIFFFTLITLYKDVLVNNLNSREDFKKVFLNILFYIYIIMAGLFLFVIYRTSRGALLGVIGGIFTSAILIAILEKRKKIIRYIAISGIFMVIMVFLLFLGARGTSYVKNNPTLSRLAEISWSNTSDQARQMVWPMALKGFKEKPILGWGQEGFNYVFNKYYDPGMYDQESWFDRAHNAPLDFLVAGGILGLLSYLSLFGIAIYLLWFRKKNTDSSKSINNFSITERALLTGLLMGYLFQAIFVFDNLISYILFFTTLAYIHSRLVQNKENKKYFSFISNFISNEEYQNYILIPVIIILTVGCVYWVNIPGIQANRTLIKALRLVQENKGVNGLNLFKSALAYKTMGDAEIREQLISYTTNILRSNKFDEQIKKDFFLLTLEEINKQIEIVPNDARYYILLGSFLNNFGNYQEALPYINKAIELSPNKQVMRFELIKALYSLHRNIEGMNEAKLAYELDTRFDQAREIYKITVENEIKINPNFKREGEKILNDLTMK